MTRPVEFTVYGNAAPAGSKAIGRTKDGRAFVRDASAKSAPWKRQVAQVAGEAMILRELLEGPLALTLTFYQPRPKGQYRSNGQPKDWAPRVPITKPDLTKLVRAVEDALTGVVWRDDAQVAYQMVAKHYGEPARCEVRVQPLTTITMPLGSCSAEPELVLR